MKIQVQKNGAHKRSPPAVMFAIVNRLIPTTSSSPKAVAYTGRSKMHANAPQPRHTLAQRRKNLRSTNPSVPTKCRVSSSDIFHAEHAQPKGEREGSSFGHRWLRVRRFGQKISIWPREHSNKKYTTTPMIPCNNKVANTPAVAVSGVQVILLYFF